MCDDFSFMCGVLTACSLAIVGILVLYISLRFPVGFFGKADMKKSLKRLEKERERIDDLIEKKKKEIDKDE